MKVISQRCEQVRWYYDGAVVAVKTEIPTLAFFGWWDSYLSASLYSGNITSGAILVSDTVRNELPEYVRGYVKHVDGANNVLQISRWSFGELNVPPYPEVRIYRDIGGRQF
jgi:hypothetical protein